MSKKPSGGVGSNQYGAKGSSVGSAPRQGTGLSASAVMSEYGAGSEVFQDPAGCPLPASEAEANEIVDAVAAGVQQDPGGGRWVKAVDFYARMVGGDHEQIAAAGLSRIMPSRPADAALPVSMRAFAPLMPETARTGQASSPSMIASTQLHCATEAAHAAAENPVSPATIDAILANPGGWQLPLTEGGVAAAVYNVADRVHQDPTVEQWENAARFYGRLAGQGKADLGGAGMRLIMPVRPEGSTLPAEIQQFGPALKDVGAL